MNLSSGAKKALAAICLTAVLAFAFSAPAAAEEKDMPQEFLGAENIYGEWKISASPLLPTEEFFSAEEVPAAAGTESTDAAKDVNPLNALNSILLLISAAAVFGLLLWMSRRLGPSPKKHFILVALSSAVLVRIAIAMVSPGYTSDMLCFTSWAKQLAGSGCATFYTCGIFADYPPGYLYILLAVGKLAALLGINLFSVLGSVLVRLPAMLLDAGMGYALYSATRESLGERKAAVIMLLVAFNPVAMLDSAAWGQVDSALALLLLLTFIQLKKERMLTAAALFGLAVLVKPQALIVGPVFALAYIFPLFNKRKDWRIRSLSNMILGVCIAFLVIFVGSLPFTGTQDTFWVFGRMLETATSYPYGSVNAFNLIALLGGNWVSQTTKVLGLSISSWGYIGIAVSLLATIYAALRARKNKTLSLPLLAALFMTLVFMLSHNMHERYLFPALFLLLLACAELKDKRLLKAYAGLSAALFLNAAAVLLCVFYGKYNLIGNMDMAVRVFSLIVIAAAGYFIWLCFRIFTAGDVRHDLAPSAEGEQLSLPMDGIGTVKPAAAIEEPESGEDGEPDENQLAFGDLDGSGEEGESAVAQFGDEPETDGLKPPEMEEDEKAGLPERTSGSGWKTLPVARIRTEMAAWGKKEPAASLRSGHPAWTRMEKLLLWALTVAYAIIAFINLGDTDVPQTYFECQDGQQIVVTLPEGSQPVEIWSYANICQGKLGVYAASDNTGKLVATVDLGYDNMFRWAITELDVSGDSTDKYSFKAFGGCKVNELVFVDADGNAITPLRVSYYDGTEYVDAAEAVKAFDEQGKKPDRPSEQNGMYFDELYHGRTAYEHLNGLKPYENSHPPLGKILIMLGIALFGMTPFGWRFSGALFGVLMLPAFYILVRRITKSRNWSFFATALMALDFMHFTQTRIATIDVFVTFFIILMYYFMYRYYELDWNKVGLKKTLLPLGLCGVFFGLGAASKWTGIYAGLGLAVLLFTTLFKRVNERRKAVKSNDEAAIARTEGTGRNVFLTLLFCIGAFIVVPLAIYLASYLPYFLCTESPYTLKGVWEVQEFMFNYHSTLTATHPYSSKWFTWPLDIRPIWYYQGKYLPDNMIESIVAFGNPAVWWAGFAGLLALIVQRVRKKAADNPAATFILVGFAAQFLPWVFITRATFIYHYFPSVPFIILALTLVLMALEKKPGLGKKTARFAFVALPVAALVLFIAFYPILSGTEIHRWYASLLKWFGSWTFYI